jgi:biopolymer transport protein ExbB
MHTALIDLSLATASGGDTGVSWLETVQKGGVIGYIIIGLSVVALALIIMHFVQIRRRALLPPHQLEELDDLLSRGDVNGALEYSLSPDNDSFLTRILSAGLTRFQKSAFGAFEVKNAIEEAGEDQTARLYRSTDALGVIGAIAPLLGLLGTVFGMIGAFESLSQGLDQSAQHETLARNISLALVTTLMGLTLAIPCISLFTFFRNRIDGLGSEAGMEIERLVLHLESAPSGGTAATARGASVAARPQPVPRPPASAASTTGGSSAGGGGGR